MIKTAIRLPLLLAVLIFLAACGGAAGVEEVDTAVPAGAAAAARPQLIEFYADW